MKKINHFLIIAIITSAGLFTNCKKKKEEVLPAPTISLDSLPSSAKNQGFFAVGNPIVLKYNAKSSDNLASVNFSEIVIPSTATGKSVPAKTSGFDTPTSYTGTYSTNFPTDANVLTIKFDAVDVKGKASSTTFIGRRIITERLIGGSTYNSGTSYYSTTENAIYNEASFAANKDKIDITFSYLGADGAPAAPMLISSDERGNLSAPTGTGGQKTYFKENTTLNFLTSSAADIYKLTESTSQRIVVEAGKIYEFVCPGIGTKGLVEVVTVNPSSDPAATSITFNVKYIKYK